MRWLIAQNAPERLPWSMLVWALVLMGMVIVGWAVIVVAKRRSEAYRNSSGPALPFTLHDLRKLHEQGQLTDAEFEKARGRILAMSKAALEKSPPPRKSSGASVTEKKTD